MIFIYSLLIKQKNEGICSDEEGSSKFKCICTPQYLGERCEIDRCSSNECQNGGKCVISVIDDIPTPECECTRNYAGPTCDLDLCLGVECGSGTCVGGTCQCDTNYININNTCEKTCSLNPCQDRITIF